MNTVEGKEMANGAANFQGSIPNQIQEEDNHEDKKSAKPNNDVAMYQQNNADTNGVAEQEPHSTAGAPMSVPMNGRNLPAAPTQEFEDTNAAMNAPTPNYFSLHNNHSEQYTGSAFVSPFQMGPPPGGNDQMFSKPPQVAGHSSQPRNNSLDSAGSQSRRHHLLRHTLPSEAVGDNAVHHFGVTNVPDALWAVQKMTQRDLQQAFERVYNVKNSSNNNNWLRKKLVEALVPKDGPNSGDASINAILDQIMVKGPSAKKRTTKETTDWSTGDGVYGGGGGVPPPYPQQKQRKQSIVRPSPLDTYPGYQHPEEYPPAPPKEENQLTAGGRRKRRAAAGVAAATAAVLRDPALEEIEKADLQRSASAEYQDRRYHANRDGGGGGGGGGGAQYHPSTVIPQVEEQSQRAIANALQTLTHLLSIAVRQGKVSAGDGGALAGALGALGSGGGVVPAGNAWGSHQYLQNLQQQQQQQQYYQQQQAAAAAAEAAAAFTRPPPPQAQTADLYAVLQHYAAASRMRGQEATAPAATDVGMSGAPDTKAQLMAALRAAGVIGNFGGQRPQQAPAQAPPKQQPPSIAAPGAKQSGGGSGSGAGQQNSPIIERLLAALGQQQQAAASAALVSMPARSGFLPINPANPANPSASEMLQRALAAHAAAHQQSMNMQQQLAVTAPAPISGGATSASVPSNIPGSNFPMDNMLMQLLQQQANAQKPTAGNQPAAGEAPPTTAADHEGAASQ